MRVFTLLLGLFGVVGAASAGDLNSPFFDSDAATGRVMFQARFGGEQAAFTDRSVQLQFGNEHQFHNGVIPFRMEYRPDTSAMLLNGVNLQPIMARKFGEEGFLGEALIGWIPIAIVVGAVAFVVVDGHDDGVAVSGGS